MNEAEIAALRAAVVGLLARHYRSRPLDTRLEKAAVAALPQPNGPARESLAALLEAGRRAGRGE